jgi:hypothetical protein
MPRQNKAKIVATLGPTMLAHFARLGWQHINLTGDYLRGVGDRLTLDGFSPLCGSRHTLAKPAQG